MTVTPAIVKGIPFFDEYEVFDKDGNVVIATDDGVLGPDDDIEGDEEGATHIAVGKEKS